jgi:hypothetical protein
MRLVSSITILILAATSYVVAFTSPVVPSTLGTRPSTTDLFSAQQQPNDDESSPVGNKYFRKSNPIVNFCATAAMTALLWGSPALVAEQALEHPNFMTSSSPIVKTMLIDKSTIANAKEKASGTGSRVNKDPESLLRLGLPINSKEVSTNSIALSDKKFHALERLTVIVQQLLLPYRFDPCKRHWRQSNTTLDPSERAQLSTAPKSPKHC